jgi:hypothetical protein
MVGQTVTTRSSSWSLSTLLYKKLDYMHSMLSQPSIQLSAFNFPIRCLCISKPPNSGDCEEGISESRIAQCVMETAEQDAKDVMSPMTTGRSLA